MTTDMSTYRGMPAQVWSPPTPQLIKNARMLIIGYEADREALEAVLPPGLTPHSNNRVRASVSFAEFATPGLM